MYLDVEQISATVRMYCILYDISITTVDFLITFYGCVVSLWANAGDSGKVVLGDTRHSTFRVS